MICTTGLAFALLTISAAPGATTSRARPTEAEALIARALELRRAGHAGDALELFRQAHDRAPSPRTLGHMGLVETSLQMWSDADAHLNAALATPDNRWVRQNRSFLAEAQSRAQTHVGELAVVGPPGARVWIGGQERGRLPLRAPVRLAEGNVRVTATGDGQKPFSVEIEIRGGTRAAVTVVLDPMQLEAAAPPPPPPFVVGAGRPADRRRWAGGALAAAGAGALLWGIIWIQTDGSCQTEVIGTGQRCVAAYSTGTRGRVLAAGGAAMLVAGGALLYAGFRPDAPVTLTATGHSVQLQARF